MPSVMSTAPWKIPSLSSVFLKVKLPWNSFAWIVLSVRKSPSMMISLINVFPWKSVSSSIWVNPVTSIGSTVLSIFDVTGIPSIQPGELSVLAGKMLPWESVPSIKLMDAIPALIPPNILMLLDWPFLVNIEI